MHLYSVFPITKSAHARQHLNQRWFAGMSWFQSCLSVHSGSGGPHVTTTPDAIGQPQITLGPSFPLDLFKLRYLRHREPQLLSPTTANIFISKRAVSLLLKSLLVLWCRVQTLPYRNSIPWYMRRITYEGCGLDLHCYPVYGTHYYRARMATKG